MTFEELYAAARAAELTRDDVNSRHLDELNRLDDPRSGKPATTERSRQPFARLRRSAG
jgi:hypothetical protein